MVSFKNLQDYLQRIHESTDVSNSKNIKILEEEHQMIQHGTPQQKLLIHTSTTVPNKKMILDKLISQKRDQKISSRGRSHNPYSLNQGGNENYNN